MLVILRETEVALALWSDLLYLAQFCIISHRILHQRVSIITGPQASGRGLLTAHGRGMTSITTKTTLRCHCQCDPSSSLNSKACSGDYLLYVLTVFREFLCNTRGITQWSLGLSPPDEIAKDRKSKKKRFSDSTVLSTKATPQLFAKDLYLFLL